MINPWLTNGRKLPACIEEALSFLYALYKSPGFGIYQEEGKNNAGVHFRKGKEENMPTELDCYNLLQV